MFVTIARMYLKRNIYYYVLISISCTCKRRQLTSICSMLASYIFCWFPIIGMSISLTNWSASEGITAPDFINSVCTSKQRVQYNTNTTYMSIQIQYKYQMQLYNTHMQNYWTLFLRFALTFTCTFGGDMSVVRVPSAYLYSLPPSCVAILQVQIISLFQSDNVSSLITWPNRIGLLLQRDR